MLRDPKDSKQLPGIGESLAQAISELVLRGKLPMLDELGGETEPDSLLPQFPGLGKNWLSVFIMTWKSTC